MDSASQQEVVRSTPLLLAILAAVVFVAIGMGYYIYANQAKLSITDKAPDFMPPKEIDEYKSAKASNKPKEALIQLLQMRALANASLIHQFERDMPSASRMYKMGKLNESVFLYLMKIKKFLDAELPEMIKEVEEVAGQPGAGQEFFKQSIAAFRERKTRQQKQMEFSEQKEVIMVAKERREKKDMYVHPMLLTQLEKVEEDAVKGNPMACALLGLPPPPPPQGMGVNPYTGQPMMMGAGGGGPQGPVIRGPDGSIINMPMRGPMPMMSLPGTPGGPGPIPSIATGAAGAATGAGAAGQMVPPSPQQPQAGGGSPMAGGPGGRVPTPQEMIGKKVALPGPDGRPMMGPDGKPILGTIALHEPSGRLILLNPNGQPLMGPDGNPVGIQIRPGPPPPGQGGPAGPGAEGAPQAPPAGMPQLGGPTPSSPMRAGMPMMPGMMMGPGSPAQQQQPQAPPTPAARRMPNGSIMTNDGRVFLPDGRVGLLDGSKRLFAPDGKCFFPDGRVAIDPKAAGNPNFQSMFVVPPIEGETPSPASVPSSPSPSSDEPSLAPATPTKASSSASASSEAPSTPIVSEAPAAAASAPAASISSSSLADDLD